MSFHFSFSHGFLHRKLSKLLPSFACISCSVLVFTTCSNTCFDVTVVPSVLVFNLAFAYMAGVSALRNSLFFLPHRLLLYILMFKIFYLICLQDRYVKLLCSNWLTMICSFHDYGLYIRQPTLRHLAVSTLRHLIEKDPVSCKVHVLVWSSLSVYLYSLTFPNYYNFLIWWYLCLRLLICCFFHSLMVWLVSVVMLWVLLSHCFWLIHVLSDFVMTLVCT